jgi:hypothetical protein
MCVAYDNCGDDLVSSEARPGTMRHTLTSIERLLSALLCKATCTGPLIYIYRHHRNASGAAAGRVTDLMSSSICLCQSGHGQSCRITWHDASIRVAPCRECISITFKSQHVYSTLSFTFSCKFIDYRCRCLVGACVAVPLSRLPTHRFILTPTGTEATTNVLTYL